ncbi:DUF5665 domain-containing protein [uncultured Roseovarius sp.]|uniref:DUF5665 domain-containing protein n=1 Tax=uncultured Roseovarius sp. TaxID=293344 RepID=UPI00262220A1|nr:DUF5665 domain-containing protein [uncultured Roseovarius sp.]
MKKDIEQPEDLTQEVAGLRRELTRLNAHRFIRVHNSMPRMLAFNFARGLAVGLGTVMGATVLLSVMVWALSQIEFLPIIGEWAAQIAQQMQTAQE